MPDPRSTSCRFFGGSWKEQVAPTIQKPVVDAPGSNGQDDSATIADRALLKGSDPMFGEQRSDECTRWFVSDQSLFNGGFHMSPIGNQQGRFLDRRQRGVGRVRCQSGNEPNPKNPTQQLGVKDCYHPAILSIRPEYEHSEAVKSTKAGYCVQDGQTLALSAI